MAVESEDRSVSTYMSVCVTGSTWGWAGAGASSRVYFCHSPTPHLCGPVTGDAEDCVCVCMEKKEIPKWSNSPPFTDLCAVKQWRNVTDRWQVYCWLHILSLISYLFTLTVPTHLFCSPAIPQEHSPTDLFWWLRHEHMIGDSVVLHRIINQAAAVSLLMQLH